MDVKDSNGTKLADGDTVTLIKDLKVKGSNVTLKRGDVVKNIRLTSDEEEIEGRSDKVKGLVLKTAFVKKAWARPKSPAAALPLHLRPPGVRLGVWRIWRGRRRQEQVLPARGCRRRRAGGDRIRC